MLKLANSLCNLLCDFFWISHEFLLIELSQSQFNKETFQFFQLLSNISKPISIVMRYESAINLASWLCVSFQVGGREINRVQRKSDIGYSSGSKYYT